MLLSLIFELKVAGGGSRAFSRSSSLVALSSSSSLLLNRASFAISHVGSCQLIGLGVVGVWVIVIDWLGVAGLEVWEGELGIDEFV